MTLLDTHPTRWPDLPGYTFVESLYVGSRTHVYRALEESSQRSVVIKLLQQDYPSFNDLLQFRNQYTIAKSLNLPGIIRPYSLEPYGNSYALVMEDFGGISLRDYAQHHSLSLLEILTIALQLAEILHNLHQQRVIHKDLKPANILIHPASKQIKLIDFSIASLLPRETQTIQNPNGLEGTLAYLAPEQTGRMNRGIDYRSDFYAFGVTLYELLTQQLPFQSNDPMELVHCHLAKSPISPLSKRPEIPEIVSEIVLKLMAKNAEDRYQSALGLKYDLEQCLHQFKDRGTIEPFTIGTRDISDRFLIPEKLYGRETEVQTLLEAFDRVAQGTSELLLVAGFSGIGKTAVINEVHKPITRQNGYFIKGKFDQFNRNIPFSAFVQAFRDLVGQLLSESDAQLQTWKTKILDALGDNAQVIIDLIPELERITGTQPPAPELFGAAAQNRFNLLFQKFIQVFTTADHPLVIFVDDLQWADSASLNLIQVLMAEAKTGYLLLLGAYRDNEVFAAHPLMATLAAIDKAGATLQTITLQPLSSTSLNCLIADTLHAQEQVVQPLTDLVMQKTRGNPFFATQFLKVLHQEQLITFDRTTGHWQCDIVQVQDAALTDDVVEFMALQLQKLPEATQAILKLAACIGAQFDLTTLAIVSEQPQTEVATALWKALQEGLVLPQSDIYKFYLGETETTQNREHDTLLYKFLHDRVQQAAYSLIPSEQRPSQHLKIGRLLLQNDSHSEQSNQIFGIISQFSQGRALIVDSIERQQIASLSYTAGLKAKTSTAYTAASEYLQLGIELLGETGWQEADDLAWNLHRQLAEVEFLCGHFEQSSALVEKILSQTTDVLAQAEVYNLLVVQNTFLGQYKAAIETGLQALKLLDIDIRTENLQAEIQQEVASINRYLADHSVLSLLDDLTEATDPKIRIAVQLLVNLDPPVYITSDLDLYILISAKIVALSLEHGYIPETVKGYGNYGWLSGIVLGDYKTGYDFGVLGMELARKIGNRAQLSKVSLSFGSWIHSWSRPVHEILHINDEGYAAGIESGEVVFGGFNLFCKVSNLLFSGAPLDLIDENLQRYLPFATKTKNGLLSGVLGGIYFLVQPLLGRTSTTASDSNSETAETIIYLDRQQFLDTCETSQDFCSLSVFYTWQMQLCCINQTFATGLDYALAAKSTLKGALGFTPISEYPIYESLILLNLYEAATPEQQAEYLQQVQSNQKEYKVWVDNCPENFLHKYLLVEAELYRIQGDHRRAADCYDDAIAAAKDFNFVHIEALAAEFAARFYIDWGRTRIAQGYLLDAYYSYARWGAKRKTEQLEASYPDLLRPILQRSEAAVSILGTLATLSSSTCATHKSSSSTRINQVLDLETILKASHILSRTIHLDDLLHQLTQIILQNSGADRCALILPTEIEEWQVRAIATSDETRLCVEPLNHHPNLPVKLIQYVKNTKVSVVVDNLKTELPVIGDYLRQHQPKSVLCLPLLNQGQLIGILYLQNQLTQGVFTDDRCLILNFLCTQAAISLENARLYQQAQTYAQQLEHSQLQIVQSEKMASLGNLVAGVAHEVNNPISFLDGSIKNAKDFSKDILEHLRLYQQHYPNPVSEIQAHAEDLDIDFLCEDLPKLLHSMKGATDRIKGISTSLRTFSRADTEHKVSANLPESIESTLLILKYRLKANEHRPAIEVVKDYGELPFVECFPGQLNQVFMNILANAIDVFDEMAQSTSFADSEANPQRIEIQIEMVGNQVEIRIRDNGKGMSEDTQARIFDHLFTTKGVGKGTGLGLTIARQIVEEKHGGKILVNSTLGAGTEFLIQLPA